MASIETFNSWAELITANSHLSLGDDGKEFLQQTADMDLNDEFPLGVNQIVLRYDPNAYSSTAIDLIIDGQGHTIKNLRTRINNPVTIFNCNQSASSTNRRLFIKNMNFVNCILSGANFLNIATPVFFENCRFVGCRTGNSYLINTNTKITLTSCYFDMPWYAANADNDTYTSLVPKLSSLPDASVASKAYYCWFHETYGGWQITDRDGDYSRLQTYPCSCSTFNLHGCYIDGRMKYPKGTYNSYIKMYPNIMSPYCQYSASVSNVIDMSFFTSDDNSVQDVLIPKISGVFKKYPINSSARFFVNNDDTSGRPDPILATPAQMQDASWLQSQGFPIIIPTT